MIEAHDWDVKVDSCLKKISREANIYLVLGLVLYGGGSALIIHFLRAQPLLVTLVVMYFFQILVIIFGTRIIFPCIAGAFKVGLLANRESMPTFEKLAEVASDDEKSILVRELRKVSLDFRAVGDSIREEVAGLREALTKPIKPLVRTIVAPPRPVEVADGRSDAQGSNGS